MPRPTRHLHTQASKLPSGHRPNPLKSFRSVDTPSSNTKPFSPIGQPHAGLPRPAKSMLNRHMATRREALCTAAWRGFDIASHGRPDCARWFHSLAAGLERATEAYQAAMRQHAEARKATMRQTLASGLRLSLKKTLRGYFLHSTPLKGAD